MGKTKFDFDYLVIGSGPAGGTAALMAAKAGLKVALIESDKWGGPSINSVDVPYRAALNFAHLYTKSIRGLRFGISSSNLRYNYPTAQNWQVFAARRASKDIKKNFENAGIECIRGSAHFLSPYEIAVGQKRISSNKILIATGATLAESGISGLDYIEHYTSKNALNIGRPPKTLVVIGGGSTGCEIAQYYAELGSKVVILELTDRLLPREDLEVGQLMTQHFEENHHIKVLAESRAISIEQDKINKRVVFMRGGVERTLHTDAIVVATGSRPDIEDLGLENAGVKAAKKGIKVNKMLQTSIKHIYAAGDAIDANSSTERAIYEGALATSNLFNRNKDTANYDGFMRTTDTYPQIATVGITEDDCLKRDKKFKKTIVPLSSVASSNTNDFYVGFVKMIADKQGKVLGATVICPEAEQVAQEVVIALRHHLSVEDLASAPHPNYSWNDAVRLAANRLSF
ncbi:NAD(P)/FAD-dependent oxidoreductase [Candidatus Saccharibacteria bacterium]|nr:NAD(P)/FAD-dependent oxidoreductase [Candidatus Saccharibacteria bacterium]